MHCRSGATACYAAGATGWRGIRRSCGPTTLRASNLSSAFFQFRLDADQHRRHRIVVVDDLAAVVGDHHVRRRRVQRVLDAQWPPRCSCARIVEVVADLICRDLAASTSARSRRGASCRAPCPGGPRPDSADARRVTPWPEDRLVAHSATTPAPAAATPMASAPDMPAPIAPT